METSPRYQENPHPILLPSPTSHSTNSSTSSSSHSSSNPPPPTTPTPPQQPRPITRSESANPYPTTFVQADTTSFKQVVQMLTGTSETAKLASSAKLAHHNSQQQPDPSPRTHSIPPIKSIPKKQNSGFKLYERRNSLKNLKINPLNPVYASNNSGFSPRKPEILSPSILDFPALVLSPVTPLIPDPFDRSGSANYTKSNCCFINTSYHGSNNGVNNANLDAVAEEKAIKEKGFYLHPSPSTTPRDAEPRLLPLFPVTSPRVSGSSTSTSQNKMTI